MALVVFHACIWTCAGMYWPRSHANLRRLLCRLSFQLSEPTLRQHEPMQPCINANCSLICRGCVKLFLVHSPRWWQARWNMCMQINTVGVGVAIGQSCMILSAGTKGKRFMLPHATGELSSLGTVSMQVDLPGPRLVCVYSMAMRFQNGKGIENAFSTGDWSCHRFVLHC